MKAYWNCTKEQLEEMFGFREKGLTEEEVERIRKETGENRLSEGRHKSLLQVFLSQFYCSNYFHVFRKYREYHRNFSGITYECCSWYDTV